MPATPSSPHDPAAAVVAEYLDAMLELPHRHDDAWPLITFDLKARMARLMVADVDRVDPRAVSTILDGPTPGDFVWDAFPGWHTSHVGSRWRLLYLLGVELTSEPTEDATVRLVHMDGTEAGPDGRDVRRTFEVRLEDDEWKVAAIPEGHQLADGE